MIADITHFSCGTHYMTAGFDHEGALEATRQNDPETWRRMVALSEKKVRAIRPSRTGSRYGTVVAFNVASRTTPGQYDIVDAALAWEGDSILIWVDVRDTARITEQTIEALAEGIERKSPATSHTRDPETGLLYNDIAIFGRPPYDDRFDPDGRYLCSFLLTDIVEPDGLSGVIAGYFSPLDQTTITGSNRTNLLYIDSKEALRDQTPEGIINVLGTMAHELQHLINYNRYIGDWRDGATHWIYNEGLSEVASIRSGYIDRDACAVMLDPNQDHYFRQATSSTDAGAVLRAYSRAMLFTHYLSERFGDDLLYELVRVGGADLEPVERALSAEGIETDAETIYADFWAANTNVTREGVEPIYRYDLSVVGCTMKRSLEIAVPAQQKVVDVTFVPFGAYQHRIINQKADEEFLRLSLGPERDYAVRVMSQNRLGEVTVVVMNPGESRVFEGFISLSVVIVNLSGSTNRVSFSMEKAASSVEDVASDPEYLDLTAVSPNHARR